MDRPAFLPWRRCDAVATENAAGSMAEPCHRPLPGIFFMAQRTLDFPSRIAPPMFLRRRYWSPDRSGSLWLGLRTASSLANAAM
jgi:hypothetical protein